MSRVETELKEVKESLETAHAKISDLSRYRWIVAGAVLLVSFVIAESDLLSGMFSQINQNTQIERSR